MYDEQHNEEIEDGDFEEITEREVRSIKDLSDEDIKLIEESGKVSAEEAATFAAEIEADVDAMSKPERKLTQREMINAVNSAVSGGQLSRSRKDSMLREMGIFKSSFTKKATPKPNKIKKRKAAKKARRKNR